MYNYRKCVFFNTNTHADTSLNMSLFLTVTFQKKFYLKILIQKNCFIFNNLTVCTYSN